MKSDLQRSYENNIVNVDREILKSDFAEKARKILPVNVCFHQYVCEELLSASNVSEKISDSIQDRKFLEQFYKQPIQKNIGKLAEETF